MEFSRRLLTLGLALLLSSPALAEDPPCLDYGDYVHLAAHLPGPRLADLELFGRYVVGVGEGNLQVIDVGNRSQPIWVTSMKIAQGAERMTLCEDRTQAVISGSFGLTRVDLSEPSSPVVLSTRKYPAYFNTSPVAVLDHMAIVFQGGRGLTLYNIADPDTFHFCSTLPIPNVSLVKGLVAAEGFVYLAASNELIVVDVSDPDSPAVTSTLSTLWYLQDLDLAGDRLAAACMSVGLQMFDITNPGSPVWTGMGDISFSSRDVELIGDRAFVAGTYINYYGFAIFDLSDSSHPTATGVFETEFNRSIGGTDSYVYVSGFGGLQIYRTDGGNLATPLSPTAFPGPSGTIVSGRGLVMEADRTFIYTPAKVLACRVSESGQLHFVSESAVPDYPDVRGMILHGDTVILPLVFKGLEIYDMTVPAQPIHAPRHVTGGDSYQVTSGGGLIYVADGWGGIRILDINPPDPVAAVGAIDPDGCFQDLVWNEDLLYTAAGSEGLVIFDVADPSAPAMIGSIDDCDEADRLDYEDGLVAVVDHGNGVHFYDVTVPDDPQHLSFLARPHFVNDILLRDGFAYLANGDYGFQVIDIREPLDPRAVGLVPYGRADYLWDTPEGLYGGPLFCILPYACAEMSPAFPDARVSLLTCPLRAWPNPFNPSTRLSFDLETASRVTLRAYDLRGRLVRTLLDDEAMSPGPHEAVWDGRDARGCALSSGTYLLRLEIGGHQVSRRVALLK